MKSITSQSNIKLNAKLNIKLNIKLRPKLSSAHARIRRRKLVLAGLTLALGMPLAMAEPTAFAVRGSQLSGPDQQDRGEPDWLAKMSNWKRDPNGQHATWLAAMRAWRSEQRSKLGYDDAQYRRPDLLWTQTNFVQPQAMVEDLYLYDPVTRRYTVQRYLDDLNTRYGGIDSVLLWPVYPNIGIDNRNQWDMLRDMPGGVPGVRQLIKDFQARGVKVYFPVMPWDTGSRDEGSSMAQATARLMAEVGADGINGDTMNGLPLEYRQAADATGHPIALEPELSFNDEAMLAWNQNSWGYWDTPFVPLVSKYKWMEPRHVVHVCDRWATDRSNILQAAFFNGTGIESWENVWGWWNQFTPRDAQALRRIATIYRSFPEYFSSADWVPHVPTQHYGVYASEFPLPGNSIWTLINRNEFAINEGILRLPHRAGQRYFDLWHGKELTPLIEGGQAVLNLPLEALGYGAVLRVDATVAPGKLDSKPDAGFNAKLAKLKLLAQKPLQAYSNEWKPLAQKMVPIAASPPAALNQAAPTGMVKIPGTSFNFQVQGVEIEGANRPGMDVQYPWESSARRGHVHRIGIKPFFIDKHPVTNARFKAFITATGYQPADQHNFLRHWVDGSPRAGDENRPVVWVALEDARAYLRWAGKRLPNEWEWQYAAQGHDQRLYPWGNEWNPAAVPTPATGRDLPPPAPVGQHPQGASPFGVEDMVGHVWQWTNEFADEHTRAAILRGGSYYQPQNAPWYFPQALKLNQHGKYLLMAPGKDRAGALGFRGVKDAAL